MQDSSLLLKAVSETEIEKIADLAKIIGLTQRHGKSMAQGTKL
jgi:hypothetical protein